MEPFENQVKKTFPAGTVIFNEGEPGDTMYLVLRGTVEITKQVTGEAVRMLARLGEGAYFGEMSLLTNVRRSASAKTLEESELLEISLDTLGGLVRERPDFALDLMRQMAHRLYQADEDLVLQSLELALLQRRPEALTSFSHHMAFVATGSFDPAKTRDVVEIARRHAADLKHLTVKSSLLRLGRGDDALLYVVETDRYHDLLQIIAPFTGLVHWEITPAIHMDDENFDHVQNLLNAAT